MVLQNIYLDPISESNKRLFGKIFKGYCIEGSVDDLFFHRATSISVYGHSVRLPFLVAGRRCCKFSFGDLCGQAYGAADYIALGQMFHVIALSNIPTITLTNRNEVCTFKSTRSWCFLLQLITVAEIYHIN